MSCAAAASFLLFDRLRCEGQRASSPPSLRAEAPPLRLVARAIVVVAGRAGPSPPTMQVSSACADAERRQVKLEPQRRSGRGGGAVHGAAAPTARTRVSRTTSMAYASLHSWERPFIAFPLMQAGGHFLHSLSLHKALCRLPNMARLHSISLDRPYAGCQSHPKPLLASLSAVQHLLCAASHMKNLHFPGAQLF
jgi:hypothetical protein